MPPDRDLRASDADRERVATELGDHLAAGRLTTEEFEQRLSSAYAALTLRDLDALLTDLPSAPTVRLEKRSPAEPAPATDWSRRFQGYGSWLMVSLITVLVWGMTSVAAGDAAPFWPMWVIGPWGLALLLGCCRGGRRTAHPDRR